MLYHAKELLVRVRFTFPKLLQIVVKSNIPLFYRYFYNHLSNYTKTIIRHRLVNIGEYSPRLRLGEYSPIFTSPSTNNCSIYKTIIRRRRSEYLTIIPRARMGYESIAHVAGGRMGY